MMKKVKQTQEKENVSRRSFLKTAAAAAGAAAAMGFPKHRQGAGADYDAMAEHLADQGHLPRVRP